jgi:hypothetical protein
MKKRVLIDAKVIADVSSGVSYWHNSMEHQAKQMESLASEFNDFVRDHRSMDWVRLDVEREYQDQCSFCGSEWELDSDGIPACCQEAITEIEKEKIKD